MGVRRVRDCCYGLAEGGRQVREMHCHGNGPGGDQSCVGRDIVPDKGKQFGFGIRSCEETNLNKGKWPDRDVMLLSVVQFGGQGVEEVWVMLRAQVLQLDCLGLNHLALSLSVTLGKKAGNSVSVPVLSLSVTLGKWLPNSLSILSLFLSVTLGKRLVIVLTFLLCGSCQSQRHPHSSVPHQTHLPIPLCSLA